MPAADTLHLNNGETLILAYIHTCKTKLHRLHASTEEIPYYSVMGAYKVVDISTLQCLVGRIPSASDIRPSSWAILDRSGSIERSFYVDGE